MSMRCAIINYFLVHKMEVENLILLSIQVLIRSNEVSLALPQNQKSTQLTTKYQTFIHGCFKKIYKTKLTKQHTIFLDKSMFSSKNCLQRFRRHLSPSLENTDFS